MLQAATPDFARIAQDLQIRKVQVESVVQLLDEGNTVPFLAHYRKERHGGLGEDVLRQILQRVGQLRQFGERKQSILKSIENQGKLTDEIREAILSAETAKRLDDLYLAFKPKKRTPATVAREKGLGELAAAVWNKDPAVATLDDVVLGMVNPEKELHSLEDVLAGMQHILAEMVGETAAVRGAVRAVVNDTARLVINKQDNVAEGQGNEYKDYFKFSEPLRNVPAHRVLAINRGEKESVLKVKLDVKLDAARKAMFDKLELEGHPHRSLLHAVALQALEQLILPSLEREVRKDLTERAQQHAIGIFARNLRSLLLQPTMPGLRVLAIDPGFRNGCRVAALDENGNLLGNATIHPHAPQNRKEEARVKLEELIRAHQPKVVAIGNGTACRETEELVADLIALFERRRQGIEDPTGDNPEAPSEPIPALAGAPLESSAESTPAEPVSEAPAASETPAAEPTASPELGAETPAPETPSDVASAAAPPPDPAVESSDSPTASEASATTEASAGAPAPAASEPTQEKKAQEAAAVAAQKKAARAQALADAKKALASLPAPPAELAYLIVNEAGSRAYASSTIGREEFPDLDAPLRGTVSIGRRLQDPLAELVKIDPPSIGVGLYQHDVNPRTLRETLEGVVESAVNHVGVDVNTAAVPLLRYVSGLNPLVARDLVEHRKQHGPIASRDQLLNMSSVGPVRFVQAAGFFFFKDSEHPLDRTRIHPESYATTQSLLEELGFSTATINDPDQHAALCEKLRSLPIEETGQRLGVGQLTLVDIVEALSRPGFDPRTESPAPILRTGMLKLEDLQPDLELKGTVLNVVDFGAFVDIGLKDSGLVHISQLANRYIKSPYDVVLVGDVVTVWVLSVDHERRRVSLTMISPGTERTPPERKPGGRAPRGDKGDRPQRGRRGRDRKPREARPAEATPAAPVAEGAPAAEANAPAPASTPTPRPSERPERPPPREPREPRRGGPPPRRSTPPARHQGGQGGQRPMQPRKPKKDLPKPKLTKDAIQGKSPLRTFSELTVFFEAKDKPDEPAAPPQPAAATQAPETPAAPPQSDVPQAIESTPTPEPTSVAPPPPAAEQTGPATQPGSEPESPQVDATDHEPEKAQGQPAEAVQEGQGPQ